MLFVLLNAPEWVLQQKGVTKLALRHKELDISHVMWDDSTLYCPTCGWMTELKEYQMAPTTLKLRVEYYIGLLHGEWILHEQVIDFHGGQRISDATLLKYLQYEGEHAFVGVYHWEEVTDDDPDR